MGGSVLGSFNHYISVCSSCQGLIMIGLILFCLVAVAQSAITPTSKVQLSVAEKLKMADDIQDADLIQDVEQLIEGLDDVTLAKLEKILSDEMSTQDELKLIQDELTEMGMDVEDVQDMLDLAAMMTDFLRKVPDVERVGVGEDAYSVEDNAKLYLLGLPNKLGPLGFLALHSVLETDESNIVDVKVGEFKPANANKDGSVVSLGDDLTRRKAAAASATAPADTTSKSGDAEKSGDLVADILARRRRSSKAAMKS